MGLFNFGKKKAKKETKPIQVQVEAVDSRLDAEYNEALKRYDEALGDPEYQEGLNRYFCLCSKINERYTVINTIGSFSDESTGALISECEEAFDIDVRIKKKREYYERTEFNQAPEMKTLAMVYEKRGEFEKAAMVCVMAINEGFPADGTAGGMRGRLARMIKKGNIELNDKLRKILEI